MAYFTNSTSGDVLEMQCEDCPLGCGWNNPRQQRLFDPEIERRPCPVHFVQLNFNYAQCEAGQEKLRQAMSMLIDENGVCQVRKVLEKASAPA